MSWEVWDMTSNTLWFNHGIFKNSIRRFKWGSVLYFLLLFFSVPFGILVGNLDTLVRRWLDGYYSVPVLFSSDYMLFPILLAMAVPTVVAALIFNSVHSTKQSIFEHGLPVTREEIYIANLASGLVLMLLPIIANAVILAIMSLTVYGQLITMSNVIYWLALNASIVFIMYSVAAATSFLTGNTAAHIGINIFVHIIPLVIALAIALISDLFLYGFFQSEEFIANKILTNTPIVWLFAKTNNFSEFTNIFDFPQMWVFLGGAILIYGLGYVLYSKRKIELSGDVAAFEVFKPILKYTATVAAEICLFGIMNNLDMALVYKFIVVAVGSAVVYFACEMLLCKSLKVFGKIKGFLVCVLFSVLFILFFAYTSVFGYETRVPDTDNIESACICESFYNEYEAPLMTNEYIIEKTREAHKSFLEDIKVVETAGYNTLCVKYRLKNGKMLERGYWVSKETYDEVMATMYENLEYKMKDMGIDNINTENVRWLDLYYNLSCYTEDRTISDDAPRIMEAVKKDLESLSYEQIYGYNWGNIGISLNCTYAENEKYNIFKELPKTDLRREYAMKSFSVEINSNYVNTYQVLKEMGIYDEMFNTIADNCYLLKKPILMNDGLVSYKEDTGEAFRFAISTQDCVKLSREIGEAMAYEALTGKAKDGEEDGKYYYLYVFGYDTTPVDDEYIRCDMKSKAISYTDEELPSTLRGLVEA